MNIQNRNTIELNGVEHPLSTTLRVAFKVQGQFNHKPYSKVFAEIGDMSIQDQIAILWTAFELANPQEAKTLGALGFQNYCLDNFTLSDVMSCLSGVIKGIMGEDLTEDAGEEGPVATNEGEAPNAKM